MIINEKSPTDLSGFYIVYKGSVLNESPNNYGISHLMEHLMCKMFEDLYDDFDRYSIDWNAYTSGDVVVFHMKGLDEYMYKYRHKLLNSLLNFTVPEKDFKKEKNVVIQEYKDTFQDQFTSNYYNMIRKVYGNYGPIGKLQSLENITYDDINDYWNRYMSSPSMIINISKNSEFDGFTDFNKKLPNSYSSAPDDELIYEKMIDFKKSCITGYFEANKDMAYIDFVIAMLGKSLKSPFFKEIRENRGLTYSIHSFIDNISDKQGIVASSLITTDDNVDEVLDVYEMILTNPDKYLTKERFNVVKDFYTVKRKKDEINAYSRHKKYILPKNWQIEEILDDMTFEKSKEIFDKYLTFDKWNWIVDKKDF